MLKALAEHVQISAEKSKLTQKKALNTKASSCGTGPDARFVVRKNALKVSKVNFERPDFAYCYQMIVRFSRVKL